jgi:septal ring factor EnvC (AmiA/AmiB activator)
MAAESKKEKQTQTAKQMNVLELSEQQRQELLSLSNSITENQSKIGATVVAIDAAEADLVALKAQLRERNAALSAALETSFKMGAGRAGIELGDLGGNWTFDWAAMVFRRNS